MYGFWPPTMAIKFSPAYSVDQTLYGVSETKLFKSTDGGDSWLAIAQGGVAGVSSYAIGQVTKTYLANGASWGEQSPKIVVQKILDSLDERSILNRIKSELKARLNQKNSTFSDFTTE